MSADTHDPRSTSALDAAALRIRAGNLVAFPTETVYGLGADALRPDAVAKVFDLKGRPANNPLIVHVADAAMAQPLVSNWPPAAQTLADAFWPGPLTIVLPKSPLIPDIVTGGGPTVALRSPDHPLALALLRAVGGPMIGPSANRSGGISPTTATHVRAAFTPEQVLVLDGGPCRIGIESTVVSLAGDRPRVLRLGAVSPSQISAALGSDVLTGPDESAARSGALPGPGMLASHYAPKTALACFSGASPPPELQHSPRPIVVLAHSPGFAIPPKVVGLRTLIRMPPEPRAYAARLYAALREADEAESELILVETPTDQGPMWDALRDRLSRAAAPRPGA